MSNVHFKLSRIILTTAVLSIFGLQVAIADTKTSEQGNTTIRDHRKPIQKNETVRDHRKTKNTSGGTVVRDHRNSTPGAQALTSEECTKLGGVVSWFSGCKGGFGTGNFACFTHDQNGTTHGVCLTYSGNTEKKISKSPKPLLISGLSTTVAPLTSQECKGLGGSVISTNSCLAKGHEACSTVDKHGVIRVACIDKVAK